MKLVVGLGNPGRRYAPTRHNVGFRIVERFAARQRIALDRTAFEGIFGSGRISGSGGELLDVGVLEPQTYMNRSGESVAAAVTELAVEVPGQDLLVVYDDVDLPFGRLRLRPSGSAGGHRGLASVIAHLGTDRFPRLRFGIDRPPGGVDTVEWVLCAFSDREAEGLDARVEDAARALETAICDGVVPAMNRWNAEAT